MTDDPFPDSEADRDETARHMAADVFLSGVLIGAALGACAALWFIGYLSG